MKLSIVVPAYNVEKYIGDTLKSLINQTEKRFEVIIVNDGSTDNTLKIVEEVMAESKLINYKIITKDNRGVSSARNVGLSEAMGQYVLFLDGDDYVSIKLVETIFKSIAKQEADIICWAFDLVSEDKKIVRSYFDKYDLVWEEMTGVEALNNLIKSNKFYIWTGSAIYRKDFLRGYGFTYQEEFGEDLEFIYKALSRALNVIFINEVLSYYVQRKGSATKSFNITRLSVVYSMKRTYEYINNIGNQELESIADIIKGKMVLTHYLWNFNSYLQNQEHFNKKNIKMMLREINTAYPGLHQEMSALMKNYKGKDLKLLIKIKAFLISPFLYNWLFNIKMIGENIRWTWLRIRFKKLKEIGRYS